MIRQCALLLSAVLCLGIDPVRVSAQGVELLYREGAVLQGERRIQITHAGPDGTTPPDTAAVQKATRYHFAVRAVGDWTLSADDVGRLQDLRLVQGGEEKTPDDVWLVVPRGGEPVVILGFEKATIDVTSPIRFSNDVNTSDPLSLGEVFAANYSRFKRMLAAGTRQLKDGHVLQAVQTLRPLLSDADSVRVPSLTAAAQARIDTAVTRVFDRLSARFRRIAAETDSVTADDVAAADSFHSRVRSVRKRLTPVLTTQAGTDLDRLSSSADDLYRSYRQTYRSNQMYRFQRGTYDETEMRLYLDGLIRLLLDPIHARTMKSRSLDTLSVSVLGSPRFSGLRGRVRQGGEWSEFVAVARLVSEGIESHGEVFGDEVMLNLKLRRPAAPQPYYEIIAAINALGRNDRAAFQKHWRRALEKCTDLALVALMQEWSLLVQRPSETISEQAWSFIREGDARMDEKQWAEAADRFREAARLVGGHAPLHYSLGRAVLAQADTAAAMDHFATARSLDPSYVPPEAARIDVLLARGEYEGARARADSALARGKRYWMVYVRKARALIGMRLFDEARQVLRGRCEPLNDEAVELYTLLTEVYIQLQIWNGAQWALQQGQDVAPGHPALAEQRTQLQRAADRAGIILEPEDIPTDTLTRQQMREQADSTLQRK